MVTRRTTQRQFLLRPSREVKGAFRYCLALAVRRSGVILHAVAVLSNHYHIVCTDPHGNLPKFTEHLNKLVGRCLNVHHQHDENFWAGNVQPNYLLLPSQEDVLAKTIYTITNPVDAGLVSSSRDWPGELLYRPGTYQAKRPTFFFRADDKRGLPAKLELEIVAAPVADDARGAMHLLEQGVTAKEKEIRAEFRRTGRTFLGATRVKAQPATQAPQTTAPRRRLSPRVASRDESLRVQLLALFRTFVEEYRAAREQWLSGDRTICFPPGTYSMRVHHFVRCAEP